jgi:hypothetical protein
MVREEKEKRKREEERAGGRAGEKGVFIPLLGD